MEQHSLTSMLGTAHRDLTAALAELERAGEFAAAAHVAAALDLIEKDGTEARVVDDTAGNLGAVAIIARRMRSGFGDNAETVARRQLAAATGPTLLAWAAIVNHIAG